MTPTPKLFPLLALTVVFFPLGVRAQTSLNVGNVAGYPGTVASVPVILRQPAGSVVAAQFDLAFNPAKVSASAPVKTARLANQTVKSREISPGVRRTLIYATDNGAILGTNGPILTLPCAIPPLETSGSGPLTPGNVVLAGVDALAVQPVSLTAGTIFVHPVNVLPNGLVQFFLYSTEDQRYVIQATTNLVDWVNISTNTATGSFLDLVDSDAADRPYRFYRWQLLQP